MIKKKKQKTVGERNMPYNRIPWEVYWKKRKKRQKWGRGGTERAG